MYFCVNWFYLNKSAKLFKGFPGGREWAQVFIQPLAHDLPVEVGYVSINVEINKGVLDILPPWLEWNPGCAELPEMILHTRATKKLLFASVWPCFTFNKHFSMFCFSFIWNALPSLFVCFLNPSSAEPSEHSRISQALQRWEKLLDFTFRHVYASLSGPHVLCYTLTKS